MPERWKDVLPYGLAGLFVLLLALGQTALALAQVWLDNSAYQYAWLVLPTVVYLLGWHYRSEFLASCPEPGFLGVAVAAVAGILWACSALMNMAVGQQFALILALQAVLMSVLGWRVYGAFFPVFALLFLLVPSGDLLQPALRLLTVKAIELFAAVLHLPNAIDGFVVAIGENRYLVLDECAGLSHFNLALFLGYSFGAAMYRSFKKVMAFATLGALIGIFSNVLRVNTIVLIDWLQGSQMPMTAHANVQWVILFVMLGLLFFVLTRLNPESKVVAVDVANAGRLHLVNKQAPVLAAVAVLLVSSAMTWQAAMTRSAVSGGHSRLPPESLFGWIATTPGGLSVIDPQGQNEAAVLIYRRKDQTLRVQVVTTLSPAAKLLESWLVPGDRAQWREVKVGSHEVCTDVKCIGMRHVTWNSNESGKTINVYYAYSIGNFTTVSKLALRAMHGWYRLIHHSENPRLVTMMFEGDDPPADAIVTMYQTIQSNL